MSTANIIRAWKDESYRSSLSEAELAALPANPAGVSAASNAVSMQLTDGAAAFSYHPCTHFPCTSICPW